MSNGLLNDPKYSGFLTQAGYETNKTPSPQLDDEEQAYAGIIKQQIDNEREALRQSLLQSVNKNPDQMAQIESLARQTGMPQDVVERNLAEVIRQQRASDLQETAKFSPILGQQLADPEFAKVAFDDVPNLSGLEYVLTKGRDYVGSLGKGVIGNAAGSVLSGFGELYGVATRQMEAAIDKVLPNSAMSFLRTPVPWYVAPDQILKRPGKELKNFGEVIGAPKARRGLDTDVLEGIGQLGFQIVTYLVTGGASSTAMMMGQGADVMAEKTRKDDATQAQKDAAIIAGSGITALTEKFGLDQILNRVPPAVRNRTLRFLADKAAAFGIEFAQELTEGLLHDITRRITTNENAPILEGALQEGTAAGLAAAIVRAGLGVRGYKQARDQEEFFKALGDNAKSSKLRERLPERFQELLAKVTEAGPVQNVYIPADQFRTYYQSQGIDPEQKAIELNARNYTEAVAAGTDLVIPISDFTARVAPSDDLQGLMQDLRLSQGDMTAREFAAYKADEERRTAEIIERAKEVAGEIITPELQQIRQEMRENLVATGYEQTTADAYATVYAKTISNLAERAGMSAVALHKKYDLTVTRPLPNVLTRNTQSDISIDPLLDRLRKADFPTRQQVYGKSLTDFLIEKGGLSPRAEIQDIDVGKPPSKRLLREAGLSIDEAAMLAVEAGYLQGKGLGDITESDLFDAIENEAAGGIEYSIYEVNQELQGLEAQLEQLQEYLNTLGIDLAQITDNAEVRRLIDQASQDPEIAGAFNELFQAQPARPQQPRLLAVHGISEDSLQFADRMGGLAAPSIGVVTEEAGAVEGFGNITLIGKPGIADPAQEPVFSADAYTVRFPRPEWPAVNAREAANFAAQVRQFDREFDDNIADRTYDQMANNPNANDLVDGWLRSPAARAMFLRERGINVAPVMMARRTATDIPLERLEELRPFYEAVDGTQGATAVLNSPEFAQLKEKYVQVLTEYYQSKGVSQRTIDRLTQDFGFGTYDRLGRDLRDTRQQVIDRYETHKAIDAMLEPLKAEYKTWVESMIVPKFGDPFLRISGKKVPYTLPNIAKVMARQSKRGAEKTMTYGMGQVRAASTVQFSDVEQMREAAKTAIVDLDAYKEARQDTEQTLENYREMMLEQEFKDGDTWEQLDASMRALARWSTGKNKTPDSMRAVMKREGFLAADTISDDDIDFAIQAANDLLNAPVPYFEAKPDRIVTLDEFAGAVVPDTASQQTLDILQKYGIQVQTYNEETGDRSQAIRDLSNKIESAGTQVFFQGNQRGISNESILYQKRGRDDYTVDMFGVPVETGEGFAAERPAGGRQNGDVQGGEFKGTYATKTEIVEENTRSLGVDRVNTPQEAAQALAYLGRGTVEHFDALVTDANGTPLAIVGAFKGGISSTSVYPVTLASEAFRIPGAANIWLAHNHPSGTNEFSNADRALSKIVANTFSGSSIKMRGIFAIAGKEGAGRKWVYQEDEGSADVFGVTTVPSSAVQVPVLDRVFVAEDKLGPPITGPTSAKQAAASISGGKSGVVLLNSRYDPLAFVEFTEKQISTLRDTGGVDALWRAISTANAAAAIVVNGGDLKEKSAVNVAQFFNSADVNTIDVIDLSSGSPKSYAESGILFSGTKFRQGEGMADKKGFIQFGPERKFKIALLERADLSTFLHESGHFYLEVLGDLAEMPESSQQIKDDYAAVLKFLNLESRQQLSLDGKAPGSAEYKRAVDAHEKFARANEAYLMEGKAPSMALRSLFQRFREWLKLVYKEITRLNVELTDEVRGVFDRIYATDEEIDSAKAEMSFDPLFLDATAAGMTEAEFNAYKQSVAQATESGKEALTVKLMKEMQREREAWWKEQLIKVREEVAAEVDAQPVYIAFKQLTEGDIKLNKDELVERYGIDYVKRLPRGFQRVYTTGEGMPLDAAARLLGFPTGDQLVEALVGMRPRNEYIKAEADRVMLDRHGDMMTDGTISDEAKIALHNNQRERVLAAELRALRRKQREVAPFIAVERQRQAAERRAARAAVEVPPMQAFREAARGMVGQTAIRDLEPQRFLNAQRREGRKAFEAMGKGDYTAAAEAKQRELLNHFLYLEATKARDRSDKIAAYMRKFETKETRQRIGKAGANYLDQIDAILDGYEFRRMPNKTIDRRALLNAFVQKQEDEGNPVNIPVTVLEDGRQINYRLLSVDELDAVNEAVRNIDNLAKLKNRLTLIAEKRELNEVASEAIEHILANAKGGKAKKLETALPGEQLSRWAKGFMAIHKKFATYFRQMDGWQDGGMMWDLFIKPLNARADWEAVQRADATKRLREIFKVYSDTNMFKKTYVPALGQGMTLQGRLMVALNWGRAENRQRLMGGNGFTQSQIDGIFETLTERDWQFVKDIWTFLDSYWPDIAAQYQKLYGVAPEKSEPLPFMTKYGEMPGGYFPIKYDPIKSTQAQAQTVEEVSRLMKSGAYVRSQTKNGFTKEVLENLDRAIKLDFSSIYEHANEVIHDLALREYLLDTNKLLNHRVDGKTIKDTINEVYGDQAYREIANGIRDIAAGDIGAMNAFDAALGHLRAGVSIIGMGWNLMTGLMQPLGLTQSFVRVGPKWVAKGLMKYGSDAAQLQNSARIIYEKSAFMRTRNLTQNREINEIRNQIKRQGKFPVARQVWGVVEDSYFFLITQGQKLVDIPTWFGAYEKALDSGASESDAVALADQAVIDAQGGGQIKDLASIQRGSQLMKIWTNFYSYFNTTFNLTVESVGKTNFKNPIDIGRLAVDMLMLYTVPAILGVALREGVNILVGGEEPDEEELMDKLIKEQITYVLGTMVGLREFATVFDPRFGYSGPAGVRFIAEVERLGTQIAQGELDDALRKAAVNVTGILLHFPAGQVNRIIDGIYGLEEGKATPAAVIFGPPKQ